MRFSFRYGVDSVRSVKDKGVSAVSAIGQTGMNTINTVADVNRVRWWQFMHTTLFLLKGFLFYKVPLLKLSIVFVFLLQRGLAKVSDMTSYGTDKLDQLIDTRVCSGIKRPVEQILQTTESYVDHYLPETEEQEGSDAKKEGNEGQEEDSDGGY